MNNMNPGMMIGMLAFGGILVGVAGAVNKLVYLDETVPRYSTNPFSKKYNNPEGEKIVTEYAMLPDDKRNKVNEIGANYYIARYQGVVAFEDTKFRVIIELYTKFGSFDAIIEHFQPSNKH